MYNNTLVSFMFIKTFKSALGRITSIGLSCRISYRLMTGWQKSKYVGVVILSNSFSDDIVNMTQRCIDSIVSLNTCKIEVLVVESGPLHDYANASVLQISEPFAYNKFLCEGIKSYTRKGEVDYLLVLNNDVLCFDKAIDVLVCAGVPSSSPVNPIGVEQSSIPRPTLGYSVRYHLLGWALMIDAAMFSKHNPDQLFPEDIRFYWQDNYYSDFIKAHDIAHYVIPKSKIVHFESSSVDISSHLQDNGDYLLYQSRISKLTSGVTKKR